MTKTIQVIVAALMISNFAMAQAPKKEFTVSIVERNISLQPGETAKYDVTLNRSKSYKNTSIDLLIDSTLPEGVSIMFENGTDPKINRIMIVSIADNAKPVKKPLILKGKTTRSSKGIMLNLAVVNEAYSAN